VGEIKGWGRVMDHQTGWRAASAYPSSLALICAKCNRKGRWTRADWVVVLGSDRPVALCDQHRDVRRGTVHSAADVTARLLADYGVKEAPFPSVTAPDPAPEVEPELQLEVAGSSQLIPADTDLRQIVLFAGGVLVPILLSCLLLKP
jgi:hypothetical protein